MRVVEEQKQKKLKKEGERGGRGGRERDGEREGREGQRGGREGERGGLFHLVPFYKRIDEKINDKL